MLCDYRRHGVMNLYAALEVATGKVTHALSARHTAADFLRFTYLDGVLRYVKHPITNGVAERLNSKT